MTILHVLAAAFILSGFFVMGVAAYNILRKRNITFFTKSFRIAVIFAVVFSIGEIIIGDVHGKFMATTQPTKLAAVEAQWETERGAPFHLFLVPDESNERNWIAWWGIPKFLSWLALGDWDAEIKGLKAWPKEERPPVALTFWSFRIMVGLGFLFALIGIIAWFKRNNLENSPWLLRLLIVMIPLPYLAAELGWIVAEVGRQPWIVYGVMKTAEAVSPIASQQVGISLAAFIVVYTLLGLACFSLMVKFANQGPDPLPEAAN
jgi:cytochrome d ubiquinol oxidase subunit I